MIDKLELIKLRKRVLENEFSRMNSMQRKAVFHVNGPLLILAGAGSGKTTVLVNRIANMIEFGDAYYSDEFYGTLSDDELNVIDRYLNGEGELDSEIKRRLSVKSVKPWNILAITFTNKAAGELKERIAARVGEQSSQVWASTFHSTCARILRRYGERLGYSDRFAIYDTDDQKRLIKDCQKVLNYDDKILPHKSIIAEISSAKDCMISPEQYMSNAGSDNRLISIAKVYSMYQKRLQEADAMDFDDLLSKTVELFEKNPDVLEYYQEKFKYIMVDEYQDTNRVQYRFVSMLAQRYNNICVVGDDDQSIYRFRGATIENILSFEKSFKDAKVIRLEQNYRSTKTILNAANSVIGYNTKRKGKTLWTENSEGVKIRLHTVRTEREESSFIADTILNGVAKGRKFSDYAILYRVNAQSNGLEQMFIRKGIPHRIIGGHRFYDREHIRDMVAYLQVINNPNDNIRLRRIINKPKRAIGDSTVNRAIEIAAAEGLSIFDVISRAEEYDSLIKAASKLKSFVDMINEYSEIAETGRMTLADLYEKIVRDISYESYLKKEKDDYEQRIEDINELKSNLMKYQEDNGEDAGLYGFLEEISLLTDIDNYDEDSDSVVLMTMHSAKGLEFPIVFLPGMEDGIFPSVKAIYEDTEMEEERRLAYVAITRAKEELCMVKSKQRMLYGSTKTNRPSTFINEIPIEYLNMTDSSVVVRNSSELAKKAVSKPTLMASAKEFGAIPQQAPSGRVDFKAGDSVNHSVFGNGMVISARPMGNDVLLEIAFDTVGTKKLMAKFARLTKI
ncbi:MAG: UvrD-helicase domain-containing protein [Clostridia bacterium]|nr:UvrD-helicase domain-containing protein [Clostridia bacterium]